MPTCELRITGGMRATDFQVHLKCQALGFAESSKWMHNHSLGVQVCQFSNPNTHVTYPLYQESCSDNDNWLWESRSFRRAFLLILLGGMQVVEAEQQRP